MSNITFAESINQAIEIAMSIDEKVICYGLGATDPKGIFGTTLGLLVTSGLLRYGPAFVYYNFWHFNKFIKQHFCV